MEIAEMLERRRIDICCLQEMCVCLVNSNKEKYKLFWNGQKTAKNGVGIFVREPLAQEAISMATLERKQTVLTTYMAVLAMENRMKMATASLSLLKVTAVCSSIENLESTASITGVGNIEIIEVRVRGYNNGAGSYDVKKLQLYVLKTPSLQIDYYELASSGGLEQPFLCGF
ncbi:hypothetical protein HELRODRAFT_169185 [Helobdella robusta]|uniref:Endonuclease/exonuclease/phosphatase domain-containing protein n=1 Tax=Helobdella robusta TaxID=6412 RepID=T1F1J5_HELRO|nr:hypothetical protein HELRODRAFT_169185 [Helobdella robusta]ESO08368.1 hypothetical protein HELRODRAFT_169185 [Helobdella robusta]